jgi:NCAIR mutase (PurE)-related protein
MELDIMIRTDKEQSSGERVYSKMSQKKISEIISRVESGKLNLAEALSELNLYDSSANFANLDYSRKERCGFPEFIFGEGKSTDQLKIISKDISDKKQPLLITRIPADSAELLLADFPEGEYDKIGNTFLLLPDNFTADKGNTLIITAGTTDLPAAMEAKATLTACGCGAKLTADSGVAGLHRIISNIPLLRQADVIIVVAGMEGALPSVVGGLVSSPVIALPTSVGYGTALGGLTAMFSMLNSCANGITVMNIDNGFGAGCAAARIINSKYEFRSL